MEIGWTVAALAGAGTGLLVFAALAWLSLRLAGGRLPPSAFDAGPAGAVFLFDDRRLVDATPGARQLLGLARRGGPDGDDDWARLMQVLRPRFPELEERLSGLLDRGSLRIDSADGGAQVLAEWRGGLARLTLADTARRDGDVPVDRLALRALEDELEVLRAIAQKVPYLTWKEDAAGRILWANAAYLALSGAQADKDALPLWPPRPVFPPGAGGRLAVPGPDGREGWHDLIRLPLPDGCLCTALPADEAVKAERGRLEFLQTLTKTFATLSAGLAVFDRQRRLVLFNPALGDLTGLPPGFLIQRPLFETFAERLREARVLPEPRDFNGWKQRVTRVQDEMQRGTFSETWTLPGGRVYEVSGRPLPDGAIAFVLQDVSDGIRLTRQFRAELELHQAALDRLEAAVALFDGDGGLVHANAAYERLWGEGRSETLAGALRLWDETCPEAPQWAALRAAPPRPGDPLGLAFAARGRDGRRLACRMTGLPGGGLLAQFTEETARQAPAFRTARAG